MGEISKVVRYVTEDRKEHHYHQDAIDWDARLSLAKSANEMLGSGSTLGEIHNAFPIWHELPEALHQLTKETGIRISHWQCIDLPGYNVCSINPNGTFRVWGNVGSWSGSYGNEEVTSQDLSRYVVGTPGLWEPSDGSR